MLAIQKAALAAKEVDDETRPRQSVQEELTNFFAETSMDGNNSLEPKKPPKGSIMSFFNKASNKTISKQTSKSDKASESASEKRRELTNQLGVSGNCVEWECKTCTFLNSKTPTTRGYSTCEMCHTPYIEDLGSEPVVPPVTPLTTEKSASKNESLVITIDDSPPAKKLGPRSMKTASSAKKPIVIDGDIKCAVKTPAKDVVVYTIDGSPGCSDKNLAVPQHKHPSEIFQSGCRDMLTFSVSKNSGRITLHYQDSGLSSLVNFDVNDVFSEDTVDRLSSAHGQRANADSSKPIPIAFNQTAVKEGTFNVQKE